MDPLQEIRTFLAVVEAGSFTAAADRLGLSKAVASKQVIRLEERLGIRLLNRTTRAVSPTELGIAYYERAGALVEDMDLLDETMRDRHAEPRGRLVVTAPMTFGEMHLTDAVSRFMAIHAGVTVDLRLTDRFVSIADEGVDLAIRISVLPDSAMVARKLGASAIVPCAAPEYLAKRGTPQTPADLIDHDCILDSNHRDGHDWTFDKEGAHETVRVAGRFRVNSARAVRSMVRRGMGIGLVPTYAVADDIRAGRLVRLMPEYGTAELGIYALYLHNRLLAGKVRAFIDFLVTDLDNGRAWTVD